MYLVFSAALWLVNATFMKLELPWTWHWLLWTGMFFPAVGAAIFAAVTNVPDRRTLRVLNAIALAGILTAMEVCTLLDARFAPVVLAMLGVSVAVVFTFRAATQTK